MNHFDTVGLGRIAAIGPRQRALCVALALVLGLSACGNSKEKKPGQTLASVNGEEITILQLNEELARANVAPAAQENAKKQLLEALIDRQLLQNEAVKDKIDRDPKVVQAIERAKALIIAQAYIQKRVANIARPTKAEVSDYFEQHPDQFARRKSFDMRQLVLATKDLNEEAKRAIDGAKSLDEIAAWFDSHGVKYGRAQLARSSVELPPELVTKLLAMPKGERFIIREGERSIVVSITDTRDTPVTLEASGAQIEQFLYNKKVKEASDAEIARLRAGAKIEYSAKPDAPAASAGASASAAATPAPAAAAAPAPEGQDKASDATARGVAGLK